MEEISIREENILKNEECANCGKPQSTWSQLAGYDSAGETYCCEPCAENTGCTCTGKPSEDAAVKDDVDFIASEGSTRTQGYNPEVDPRPFARRER